MVPASTATQESTASQNGNQTPGVISEQVTSVQLTASAGRSGKCSNWDTNARKRPGKPFLPGSVVLGPVNSGLWAFSGEVSDEQTGAGLA